MDFLNSVMNELGNSGKSGSLGNLDVGSLAKTLLSSTGEGKGSQIDSIISILKKNGLEEKVLSWVGNGSNIDINESDISKALGDDTMNQIASKLGVEPSQVSTVLATLLPVIVNQLTPDGKEGDGGSLLNSGMNVLKGFL